MSRADDDYDDRPRRRRDDDDEDDDYDDRPRRGRSSGGGTGGVLGVSAAVIVIVLVVGLLCCGGLAVALLLPAVSKVREAAARAKDMNNYRQIAIGFHAHNDTTGRLPRADDGLSWRVALLPYVEQANAYNQFDRTAGWDAPANRRLADVRIPVYVSALDDPAFVQARARVFTGPDTLFPPGEKPLSIRGPEVKDGTSNTFLAVEARESVPWPQPRELPYSPAGALPELGHPQRPAGFIAAFADGSVKFIPESASAAARRAAVTATAGDVPPDF